MMTRPDTQALYVMQNEFGLIKIGRSLNPDRRRQSLQGDEGCAISVVAALEQQGHMEEAIHLSLEDYALEGEWFDGTAPARAAIIRAIPVLADCEWPFEHSVDGAVAWLDAFYARRDQRLLEKQYRRVLKDHLQRCSPGADADGGVCHLVSLIETGRVASLMQGRLKAEKVVYVRHQGSKDWELVPPYTTDLALALSLWPDDIRPAGWEGGAHECAVAAMTARFQQLR